MKYFRQIFSILLISMLAFSGFADDFEHNGIWYRVLNAETKTCETIPGPQSYNSLITSFNGELVIPENVSDGIDTFSVVAIGEESFQFCKMLTSIQLPETLTSIGDRAFLWCEGLILLELPESLTSVGNHAFDTCTKLRSLELSKSLNVIGEYAFYNCWNITSLKIPESLTIIGDYAFAACRSLTSLIFPESVTSIGNGVFFDCERLTSLILPESIVTIGYATFASCRELELLSLPKNLISIGQEAFRGCSSLTSLTIPESLISIGQEAFQGCSSLTSLTIPESLISIENRAFAECSPYIEVTYTASLPINMSGDVFAGSYTMGRLNVPNIILADALEISPWNKFKKINAKDGSKELSLMDGDDFEYNGIWYTVLDSGINTCKTRNSRQAVYVGDLVIPQTVSYGMSNYTVTSIGDKAFLNCSELTSITLPESVISIGDDAFNNCYSLTSINIPKCVTSIGSAAFYKCDGLASLTFPETLTVIGDYAFYECSSLIELILPDSLTSIGICVFSGCRSLSTLSLPNTLTSIGYMAFGGCSSLTSLTLPETLTVIEDRAFYECNSLISLKFPNTLISIGDYAFYECSGLIELILPDSLTSIGICVFSGCRSLSTLSLPNTLTSIGYMAFGGCSSLTSLIFPKTLSYIDESAFINCRSIMTLILPESLTSIEGWVFCGCSGLSSITFPETLTSIGSGAFEGCSSITSLVFPESLTHIGSWAFIRCKNLTSICLPASINEINEGAFADCGTNCGSIREIYYNATIPIMQAKDIFDSDIYSNSTLIMPNATLSIIQSTVPWSDFERIVACDGTTIKEEVEHDGIVYVVTDATNCIVATKPGRSISQPGNTVENDLTLPASFTKEDRTFYVKEIGDYSFSGNFSLTSVTFPASIEKIGLGAFLECDRLTSIVWNAHRQIGTNIIDQIANPNLLIYVDSIQFAPDSVDHNIVILKTKDGIPECQNLIVEHGYGFRPLINFRSKYSSLTKEFKQETPIGGVAGWETIVLPFDVAGVKSNDRELIPFGLITDIYRQCPYWLYSASEDNIWDEAFEIQAGIPYLISVPRNSDYSDRYNIEGPITFYNPEPTIISLETAAPYIIKWNSGREFRSLWLPMDYNEAKNSMGLNVNISNLYDDNGQCLAPGSAFHVNVNPQPIEAYVTTINGKKAMLIKDSDSVVIPNIIDKGLSIILGEHSIKMCSMTDCQVGIYTPDGITVCNVMLQAGKTQIIDNLPCGMYIVGGKKIAVR